ncbi:MAG: hypothetical protein QOH62_3532, partial [Solirubrobacteraceae bacterium]|nr:hypothetical protein [Solirubrobacteraceae bacterium]
MAVAAAVLVPTAATARGLDTGFFDGVYTDPDAALRDTWLQRTADEAAT